MKNSNEFKYHFDLKSVYLVPLMAFTISISLIFAVVKTSESQDVGSNNQNIHLTHKTSNLLAEAKIF